MPAPFEIVTHSPGPGNPSTYLVRQGDRVLGGFGSNYYRSWVFPLYAPSGRTVLDAFPVDHPFHNGIFVAQYPVRCGNREGNFWVTPPRRSADDPVYTKIGRCDAQGEPVVSGSRLTLRSVWRDENEQPLLDEERIIEFGATASATVCEVTTRKIAAYGPVEFPATKYGGIGARIEPRLLPALGGRIETADRRVTYRQKDWGVVLEADGPWLVREYGMCLYNPTLNRRVDLAAGESWSGRLRVEAFG